MLWYLYDITCILQPSPCTESEGTRKESQEDSENVGMEQVLAPCESAVVCESYCTVKQECTDPGSDCLRVSCDGKNTLHNEEGVMGIKVNLKSLDQQNKLDCKQTCSERGDKTTARDPAPASNSHPKLTGSCHLEAVDVECGNASEEHIITKEHQACLTPAKFQDGVQQVSTLSCGSELRGKVLYKENVSVAVQCSVEEFSPLKVTTVEDKSTQTHSATYADNAVQTTTIVDGNITSTNMSSGQTEGETISTVKPLNKDDLRTLRRELDSMQSTVIWQALMLRLYGMH